MAIDPANIGVLAFSLDVFTQVDFWTGVGVLAGIYALVGLGLQLNVGFTGIVNFGAAGFMAVGAYAMAILTVKAEMSFWLALPLAAAIAVLFGLIIGLPALRLRADYLAIATIAFAEIVRIVAQNALGLTGGNQGLFCEGSGADRVCYKDAWENVSNTVNGWLADIGLGGLPSFFPLLLAVWLVVVLVTLFLRYAQSSPWGRVLRAVREDEDAARALGKNAFSYKLQSLAIAAVIGAMAGWFLALNLRVLHPDDFQPIVTFFAYSVLVLGGLASYWGVLVGSVVFWAIIEGTRQVDLFESEADATALRFALIGILLMVLMAFRPQGAFGKREEMTLGD